MTAALPRSAMPTSTPTHKGDDVVRRVTAEHARDRRRTEVKVQVGTVVLAAIVLLVWQFVLGHIVNPRYISNPVDVISRLIGLVAEGEILRHMGVTLLEAGSGFVIGVTLGLVSAFGVMMTRRGYDVVEPFLIAFYSIPKIALAPLFILWFGLGLTPKILLAALMVFFIVFMNTVAGIRTINAGLIEVSRIFGANKWELARKIMFPAAVPAIVASIRITFTRAIEGAVLAEFISSTQGLGYIVVRASRQFDIPTVFAGILIIALVVMTANGLLRILQTKLIPWHSGEVHG